MPLKFATKAFSYNLAKLWSSFCCKLHNILLSRTRICPNLDLCFFLFFLLIQFQFVLSLLLLSFFSRFLFSLSFTFYLLSIHWKSFGLSPSKHLEMEHWSTRWLGLFYHQFCTQNWTRFSGIALPEFGRYSRWKMDTRLDGSVLTVLAAYQNNLVSWENDDDTSGSMFSNSNIGKIRLLLRKS